MGADAVKKKTVKTDALSRLVASFMELVKAELRKRGEPNGYIKEATGRKWVVYALHNPMELEERLAYAIVSHTHRGNTVAFKKKLAASVYGETVKKWREDNKGLLAEVILTRRAE